MGSWWFSIAHHCRQRIRREGFAKRLCTQVSRPYQISCRRRGREGSNIPKLCLRKMWMTPYLFHLWLSYPWTILETTWGPFKIYALQFSKYLTTPPPTVTFCQSFLQKKIVNTNWFSFTDSDWRRLERGDVSRYWVSGWCQLWSHLLLIFHLPYHVW